MHMPWNQTHHDESQYITYLVKSQKWICGWQWWKSNLEKLHYGLSIVGRERQTERERESSTSWRSN